jgi:hypothetical protein
MMHFRLNFPTGFNFEPLLEGVDPVLKNDQPLAVEYLNFEI